MGINHCQNCQNANPAPEACTVTENNAVQEGFLTWDPYDPDYQTNSFSKYGQVPTENISIFPWKRKMQLKKIG